MANEDDLTFAYLAGHPADAARVLETLPREASVALLSRVPARIGAPVLGALRPASAAAHLAAVEPDRAVALLGMMRVQAAAAALRLVPEPRRAALLDALPSARAVAYRLLLNYPATSVGAWAQSDLIVLGPDTRAGDASARLGEEADKDVSDGVYVTDTVGRLLGVVPLSALVRAPAHLRLAGLMRPVAARLPATMPVAAALRLRAWDEALSLPVVDSRDHLVGRVPRAALSASASHRGGGRESGGLLGILASTYWTALSGLLAAVVSVLPTAPPVGRAGR